MPTVSFFLSTERHRIDASHALWQQRLPIHRQTNPTQSESITYGHYFSTVAAFCTDDGWHRILTACSRRLERTVSISAIEALSIFLEKHGAFYHPARLAVHVDGRRLGFVVNVAVSESGRQSLPREVSALRTLAETRPFGWFPAVHAWAFDDLPMFMGDWQEGFHEFHLTARPASPETAVVVWDGGNTPHLLSDVQAAALYRQATMILTACYHPLTSQQIFPWHHAAGDFVVRLDDRTPAVRLITVRDYRAMAGPSFTADSEAAVLEALLVFFVHLSVRMRLDRLDGVGAVAWAPDEILGPVVDGFFQGLELTAALNGLPDAIGEAFRHYFGRHDEAALRETARQVMQTTYLEASEERRVIGARLDAHIHALHRLFTAAPGA